ncbi:MAG: hypothetical protein MI749_16675 [Desulfovibrionales bacterium]|nr:hypothetical protein [Desulfovibrionales bacterium]
MTVSSQRTVHTYVCDGVEDHWPILFMFQEPEQVKAVRMDRKGVETPLVYGSDYVVEQAESGAVCIAQMKEQERIILYLDIPLTQETDLCSGGKLTAEAIEQMSDKLTLGLQQQQEVLDRCFRMPLSGRRDPGEILTGLERYKNEMQSMSQDAFSRFDGLDRIERRIKATFERLEKRAEEIVATIDMLGDMDVLFSGMVIPFRGEITAEGHPIDGLTGTVMTAFGLCDGTVYTRADGAKIRSPNMVDRFMVGAGKKYRQGDKGGTDAVALALPDLPPHTHSIPVRGSGTVQEGLNVYQTGKSVSTSEFRTKSTGSSRTHENRPPYYAVAYIIKL